MKNFETSVAVLNSEERLTGSQCNFLKTEVTLMYLDLLLIHF